MYVGGGLLSAVRMVSHDCSMVFFVGLVCLFCFLFCFCLFCLFVCFSSRKEGRRSIGFLFSFLRYHYYYYYYYYYH